MEICNWDTSKRRPPARRVQFDDVVIKDALVDGVGNGKCESLDDAAVPQDARVMRQHQSMRVGRFVFDEPKQATVCGEAAVLDAGEACFRLACAGEGRRGRAEGTKRRGWCCRFIWYRSFVGKQKTPFVTVT